MSTKEILLRAAQLIEERGHCKHVQEDEQGRLCIYGAICAARGEPPKSALGYDDPEEKAVRGFTLMHYGEHIGVWNDRPERTQKEVVSVLRTVANQV